MRRLALWMASLALVTANVAYAKPDKAKPAVVAKTSARLVKADAATARHLGDAFRAYDAGELETASKELAKLGDAPLANRDYAWWLRGMVALRAGDAAAAQTAFDKLATISGSRFAPQVAWRLADVAWLRGDRDAAAKQYAHLLPIANAEESGDLGTAMFRIAEVKHTAEAYRALVIAHPSHPLAAQAEAKMLELGGAPLGPADRVERAKQLTTAHLWDQAIEELALVPRDGIPDAVAAQRDYWTGTTLYEMRRRYADAGQLLLGVYARLGDSAAEAMFHGARALSRADRDDDAIAWYHKVVAAYPSTAYAQEAQFLSGWLEFNRGHYQAAIKPLEDSLAKYPHSKWADDSLWFLAMSHYFLNHWDQARTHLAALAKLRGSLEGGKGSYWLARIDQRLAHQDAAIAGYRETVTKFPFSWYALLSRARLAAAGVTIGPFGDGDGKPRGPKLAATVDEALATDDLIARADELISAGLGVDAGQELARGEKAFLARAKVSKSGEGPARSAAEGGAKVGKSGEGPARSAAEGGAKVDDKRGAAFAMLLDRYRKAGNYNRPWMLAVSYSGSALDGPPEDDAQRWWENAYPRAYRELVEKYQALGDNPEGYLYSIMRKESGFDPHDLSYADAQGLLQMIPPTTQRVAKTLGIPYDAGKLYEPEYNIKTGSWYIGHLLSKFKKQIPLGAGSFNSGPKPVMKWIDTNGDRDIDELVELVPYTQTREYMKKVTENYARYRYLYAHELYDQPLAVDKQHYIVDQLTY